MTLPESTDDSPLAGEGASRLLAHLRATLAQPGLSYAEPPARLSGGNETYIYDLRLRGASEDLTRPLILRAYRAGYARPDQARFESAVQNALAGLGYPAPRVLIVAPEPTVLGTPFIVMERLPGTMLLEGIGELDEAGQMHVDRGRSLVRGIGLLRTIPRTCAQAQLRLHALDAQPLIDAFEREDLPQSSLTLEGRFQALRDYIDQAQLDGLRPALDWLIDSKPPPERLVICHCDMQPNNMLMSGDELTGVVDWSQVLVADPALDVGCTKFAFETVPLQMPRFLNWLGRPVAWRLSRDYMRTYTKGQPVRRESVQYYGVLRALFVLTFIGVRRSGGRSEPDIWDNQAGIRNLIGWVRSVTGIDVRLPDDTRAGRA